MIIPIIVVIMIAPRNVGKNLWEAYINTYFPTSASGIILEATQAAKMIISSAAATAPINTLVAYFAPSALLLAKNL